ncbi:hypothetical protein HYT17_00045 [Candidatus Microgenomates bacterium]|nr:hypothetical protein [Candidatus Microgenomates bacterium]
MRKFAIFTLCFLAGMAAVILVLMLRPKQHVVYYDGQKFTPQFLTIKLGDSVTVKNNSYTYMELAVGEHKSHRTLAGFEEKVVEAQAAYTFTPGEKGVFDFHDHLNPKKLGLLTIK